jgi:hypothetical protein
MFVQLHRPEIEKFRIMNPDEDQNVSIKRIKKFLAKKFNMETVEIINVHIIRNMIDGRISWIESNIRIKENHEMQHNDPNI